MTALPEVPRWDWIDVCNTGDTDALWCLHADHVAALAAQATAHEAALAEARENAADYWGNRAFDHYRDGLKAGRDQVMTASYAQAVKQGVSDERARIRAGVEALMPDTADEGVVLHVLAVIDGAAGEEA